jgi:hypothetical protein
MYNAINTCKRKARGNMLKERSGFKAPKWVRRLPAEIRGAVEQEYYVDPEQAKLFAAAGTMEKIRQLRRERWDLDTGFHSSLEANGEIVLPGEIGRMLP